MANTSADVPYIVLINTNQYAGNFERQMTAYCTGVIGECGVGRKEAQLFEEETSEEIQALFEDALEHDAGDSGCYRPCSMWDTSKKNDWHDVAIFFGEEPTTEQLEVIKQRAVEFANQREYQGKMKINTITVIKRVRTTVDTVLTVLK
jgi:hypothetical protein